METRILIVGLMLALPVLGHAGPACYADPRTDAYTCYDKGGVTEKTGIRYSRMWRGGPNGVELTTFQFAVNCNSGVMHLKDRQGVSFGGGRRGDTPVATQIIDWICAEPLAKSAPSNPLIHPLS